MPLEFLFNMGYNSPKEWFLEYGFVANEDLPEDSEVFAETDMTCRVSGESDFKHGYMRGSAKRGDTLVRALYRTPAFYVVKDGKIVEPTNPERKEPTLEALQRKLRS